MIKAHEHINEILPQGELLRGFAAQNSISRGELKKVLRSRGVFFKNNEKEEIIPCLATLLLSPSEFEVLKDCQNTREDNLKKSTSRLELCSDFSLIDSLPDLQELRHAVEVDHVSYNLTKLPDVQLDRKHPNRMVISYEIERIDRNKSWFESKNVFSGHLFVEKTSSKELSITKSYTSPESEEVANKFQNLLVEHYKSSGFVGQDTQLKKILFKDFTNAERIAFFWRLTSRMDGTHFTFVDIEDVEFRPDESMPLPEKIDWMAKKKELILKGTDIHNTFFISDSVYYPHLQFWGLQAKFNFQDFLAQGSCIVNFLFKDFIDKQGESEFEINISSISSDFSLSSKRKAELKQSLLSRLEKRKNELYHEFFSSLDLLADQN